VYFHVFKMVHAMEPEGSKSEEKRGLVSRRVEMYEAPILHRQPQKVYHRPLDSFSVKDPIRHQPTPLVEKRCEESTTSSRFSLIESGVDYYANGDYDKAMEDFENQLVSLGDDDLSTALTLSNIGATYLQQGDFGEAEKALQSSLEIKKRLQPTLIVADTLTNLGNCANLRGDFEQSLTYYREALNDLRKKRGKRLDVANALFNIGRLEIQQQQWEQALTILSQAYRMNREVYGTHHEYVAQTLELVGFVHLQSGNSEAAMTSFTSALGIYRKINRPLHADIANTLFNIGMVREAKGDFSDAWEAYTTARDIHGKLGTDLEDTGFVAIRQSISNVDRAIAKQTQARLVAKHQQVTDLLNATKKQTSQ